MFEGYAVQAERPEMEYPIKYRGELVCGALLPKIESVW